MFEFQIPVRMGEPAGLSDLHLATLGLSFLICPVGRWAAVCGVSLQMSPASRGEGLLSVSLQTLVFQVVMKDEFGVFRFAITL